MGKRGDEEMRCAATVSMSNRKRLGPLLVKAPQVVSIECGCSLTLRFWVTKPSMSCNDKALVLMSWCTFCYNHSTLHTRYHTIKSYQIQTSSRKRGINCLHSFMCLATRQRVLHFPKLALMRSRC